MSMKLGFLAALVAVWMLAAGGASAGIVNGYFDDGNTGWDIEASGDDAAHAFGQVDAGQLHLYVKNTYKWDDGASEWVLQDAFFSYVDVYTECVQDLDGNYAPAGTTGLRFTYDLTIAGNPPGNEEAYVELTVTYNDGSHDDANLVPVGAGTHVMGFSSPLEPGEFIEMGIYMQADMSGYSAPGVNDPNTRTIEVDARLDNVEFVPEPTMLALLALGGAAGLGHRRRR